MIRSSEKIKKKSSLSIAAVGDISFAGPNADSPEIDILKSIRPFFDGSDLVVGNLEGPLFDESRPVPDKCTIRGNTGWAGVLKMAGIHILSLANNHIMDHGEAGLFSTISALEKEGIQTVGAGADIGEARKPIFKELNGCRFAILARTSVIVDSPSYAGEQRPGVAFLNMEELLETLKACRKQADLVVLVMHWGVEHYEYPTPDQRRQAKAMIEAGVHLIVGHHPHVTQGYEHFGEGIAAYSLGNFVFDEFEWTIKSEEESIRKLKLPLAPENRRGLILKVNIQDKRMQVIPVFTRIEKNGSVSADADLQRVAEFNRLCGRLEQRFYDRWWQIYALKKEWKLRFGKKISLKNSLIKFRQLRPRHFQELLQKIRNSMRILTGRSTNPYE